MNCSVSWAQRAANPYDNLFEVIEDEPAGRNSESDKYQDEEFIQRCDVYIERGR